MPGDAEHEKERIFADLGALHQSTVSEAPEAASAATDDTSGPDPGERPSSELDNRYELFCEHLPMGVLLAEVRRDRYRRPEQFTTVKVNMAYAQLLGLARVTVLERDFFEVLPGGRTDWQELLVDVAGKGRSARRTVYWESTDTHFQVTLFLPRRDLLAVVIEDAGSRAPVAGSVAKHESQLDSVLRVTPELVCRFLPDGTLTYANLAYCEFFKKVREELVGHCFLEEIAADDVGLVRSHLSMLNRDRTAITYQHRFMGEAGLRWVAWTDIALLDAAGTITEYQSSGRDITALRQRTDEIARIAGYMEDLLRYRAQQHSVAATHATERSLSSEVLSTEVTGLQEELARLKKRTITGELQVCSSCKRVHDDEGHWMVLPLFLENHTVARVESQVCPYCRSKAERELERAKRKK